MDPSKAASLLSGSEIPMAALQGREASTGKREQDSVVWTVKNVNGAETLRLIAKLSPLGSKTQVDFDIQSVDPEKNGALQQEFTSQSVVKDLFLAIVGEHVDSTLNRRDFNYQVFAPIVAKAIASGAIPTPGEAAKQAEKQFEKQDQENLDHAYANEGRE